MHLIMLSFGMHLSVSMTESSVASPRSRKSKGLFQAPKILDVLEETMGTHRRASRASPRSKSLAKSGRRTPSTRTTPRSLAFSSSTSMISFNVAVPRMWPQALTVMVYYYKSDLLIFHIYAMHLSDDEKWINPILEKVKLKNGCPIMDDPDSYEPQQIGVNFNCIINPELTDEGGNYLQTKHEDMDLSKYWSKGDNIGLARISYSKTMSIDKEDRPKSLTRKVIWN